MAEGDDALGRAIFEHARDAMLWLDREARILDANRAATELFARTREELIGRKMASLCGVDEEECRRTLVELDRLGMLQLELDVSRPDGTHRRSDVVLTAHVVPGRHLAVHRDVTERRAREIEADRYRVLWQRARDVVFFIAGDGRILDANDAAVEAYGYSRDELLGKTIHDLRAPETRNAVPEQIEGAFQRGLLFETVHLRRDGTRMPVEVGSRATVIGGERLLLSVIRDVGERKQMQARLAQADRLASVGTLAAGVAHEINNPLSYAMTSVELALRLVRDAGAAPVPARTADVLATALHGIERVRAIVRDLKMFARTDDVLAAVDVRKVIEGCLDVAQHELRTGVRLVREYGDVPPVRADEGRLAQVFLNLIVNAAHAVRDPARGGGTISIETTRGEGGTVIVRVRDDGPGIAVEVLPRVFDAFVTTKAPGEGTGLGLYLSRSIVADLGGTIEVEPGRARGATFRVTLPAAPDLEVAVPSAASRATARRARILVVDDEIAIGRMLGAALEAEHDLVVLTSAEAALERLAEDDRFDVVLTDVSMHGMSGLELLAAIRARHPHLASRTIFMTGGAIGVGRDGLIEGTPVLDKPFAVAALREQIARIVGEPG